MMTTIDLGDNDRLEFEPARHALRLFPAVGGGRLELRIKISRVLEKQNVQPYRIFASLLVGTRPQQGRQFLCRMDAENLVQATTRSTDFTLNGFVTDHQLRVVEQLRGGKPLYLTLQLDVSYLDGEPRRLISKTGELVFDVGAGEWSEQVENVDGGSFIEVLVPMPGNTDQAAEVARLRQARELLRDGNVEEALVVARKALESVRLEWGTVDVAKAARSKSAKTRNKEERWAVMVEDTYSLMSGAAHDDPEEPPFRWSRAEGVTLVVTTAGLLGRLVENDHQQGP